MEAVDIIKTISTLASNFQEGDLLTLIEIQEELKKIDPACLPDSPKEAMIEFTKLLDQADKINDQEEFMKLILKWVKEIEAQEGCLDTSLVNNTKVVKTHSEPGKKDYASLIEDKEMLGKFYDEAIEHLNNAQVVLIDLEYDTHNEEIINTIFRSFHTIKGSAAFLGIKNIEETAHAVENMLALVRDGKLTVNSDLIDVIFFGIRFIEDLTAVLPACEYNTKSIIKSFLVMKIAPLIDLVNQISRDYSKKKIGEILHDMGKIDKDLIDKVLTRQQEESKRFGDILIEEQAVSESDLKEAIKIQKEKKVASSYVKVSAQRLNDLVDMVGELVVTQSMIRESIQTSNSADRNMVQLETISTNIKNIVLSMGMVPIAEIFNRLKIVIRNAGRELNKLITVDVSGEETELDRNLMEAIYDPLVHMARNAADHGIESNRKKAGKAEVGHIHIIAEHRGNGIEISIEDDGKGMDPKTLIKKALEKGIINEDQAQEMLENEKDALNLIFSPGFSTKEAVTELSGRGVGMDVVRKNIESIRGKVEISSQKGTGSKFTIKLPLTLAIIDGFVTLVQNEKYIFPFTSITEIVVPEADQLKTMENGEMMLNNRGDFIPVFSAGTIIRLAKNKTQNLENDQSSDTLPVQQTEAGAEAETDDNILPDTVHMSKLDDFVEAEDRTIILIINHDDEQYGVAVDAVLGKQEIVIKSLNEVLRGMEIFSGGTIFGDGSIGFVIDIEEFLAQCQ